MIVRLTRAKGSPSSTETVLLGRSTRLAYVNVPADAAEPTVGYRVLVWLESTESRRAKWARFQGASSPREVALKAALGELRKRDANGDHVLSREELPHVQQAMFSKWDLNDDGLLDRKEWLECRLNHKPERATPETTSGRKKR